MTSSNIDMNIDLNFLAIKIDQGSCSHSMNKALLSTIPNTTYSQT